MLVKWNPYSELERTVDGLFQSPFGLSPVWDDRNAIEAQLPGVDLKDIELSLKEQTLHIQGERRDESEKSKEGYHVREARYGKFSRSFVLPNTVNPDEAKAAYEKGVLTITIPKQEKAKPRTIRVEAK